MRNLSLIETDLSVRAADVRARIAELDSFQESDRAARDPAPIVDQMSDVQKRVYRDGRTRTADVEKWADGLFNHNREVFLSTIERQLSKVGCGSRPAVLGAEILDKVRASARDSARSIANTFNYDLARQIRSIGGTTPPANYRTYRSRLFGDTRNSIYAGLNNWAAQRSINKMMQVAVSETNAAINSATQSFYRKNYNQRGEANVLPLAAVCPICQRGVAGNPYRTPIRAERAGPWPAHPNCVHYVEVTPRAMARDCEKVWRGGG